MSESIVSMQKCVLCLKEKSSRACVRACVCEFLHDWRVLDNLIDATLDDVLVYS